MKPWQTERGGQQRKGYGGGNAREGSSQERSMPMPKPGAEAAGSPGPSRLSTKSRLAEMGRTREGGAKKGLASQGTAVQPGFLLETTTPPAKPSGNEAAATEERAVLQRNDR
eukprot:6024550-Pyramimonas_sp.AAC.1